MFNEDNPQDLDLSLENANSSGDITPEDAIVPALDPVFAASPTPGEGGEESASKEDIANPEGVANPEDVANSEDANESETVPLPLEAVVEAIIMAAREPLKLSQIAHAAGRGTSKDMVREAIDKLNLHYLETNRAFEIAEIAAAFQILTRPEYYPTLCRLYPEANPQEKKKNTHLPPSVRDTLCIIAYKQPVTRGEIERIRGVNATPSLQTLIKHDLIKVSGRLTSVLGQPLTYATTDAFLIRFGLGSLDELPLRGEIRNSFPEPPPPAPVTPLITDGTVA